MSVLWTKIKKKYKFLLMLLIAVSCGFAASAQFVSAQRIYAYAKNNDYKALQQLGSAVDTTDSYGNTAACLALSEGNMSAYRTLVQYGANPRPQCTYGLSSGSGYNGYDKTEVRSGGMSATGWLITGAIVAGGVGIALAAGGGGGGGGGGGSSDQSASGECIGYSSVCGIGYMKSGRTCRKDGKILYECVFNDCSGHTLTEVPAHCAEPESCVSGGLVTYKCYKCADGWSGEKCDKQTTCLYNTEQCSEGYEETGNTCKSGNKTYVECKEKQCEGYDLEELSGHCAKSEKCLSGRKMKYKCDECEAGWDIDTSCQTETKCAYDTTSCSVEEGYEETGNTCQSGSKTYVECRERDCSEYTQSGVPSKCLYYEQCKSGKNPVKIKCTQCMDGWTGPDCETPAPCEGYSEKCDKGYVDSGEHCMSGTKELLMCVPRDCSEYPLTMPPERNCDEVEPCLSVNTTTYRCNLCKKGWTGSGCQNKATCPEEYVPESQCINGYEPTGKDCYSGDVRYVECKKISCEGYTLPSCPLNAEECSDCKSDSGHLYKVEKCKEGWEGVDCATPTACEYDKLECTGGYEPTGKTCVSGGKTYVECKPRDCRGYSESCEKGYEPTDQTCQSEDKTYVLCQKVTCPYSTLTCVDGYHETGATCQSGDQVFKQCALNDCSGYTLENCPIHAEGECKSCQTGDTIKYKVTGCKSGWTSTDCNVPDPECKFRNTSCAKDKGYEETGAYCYYGNERYVECTTSICDDPPYDYDKCPPHARSCGICETGGNTMYKVYSCKTGWEGDDCGTAHTCEGYTETRCKDGYHQVGESCQSGEITYVKCEASGCAGYDIEGSCPENAENCESCLAGDVYKYKVKNCKEGWSGSSCETPATCPYTQTACTDGYKPTGQKCKSGNTTYVECVPQRCEGYSASCSDGYDPDNTDTCKVGDATYIKCNPHQCGEGYVANCSTGYEPDRSSPCKSGDINLYKCKAAACDGYPASGKTIEHCQEYSTPCKSGNEEKYKCMTCNDGYKINSVGECDANQATDCTDNGFLYTEVGEGKECVSGGSTCMAGDTKYYRCTNCKDGYKLENAKCIEKPATDCTDKGYTYTSTGSGQECEEAGMMCQAGDNKYYKCSKCKDGLKAVNGKCVTVSDAECMEDGYYYKETDTECKKRGTSCVAGNTTYYKCLQCADGYSFNAQNICEKNSAVTECAANGFVYTQSNKGYCEVLGTIPCQSGNETYYMCSACQEGYVPNSNGVCAEKSGGGDSEGGEGGGSGGGEGGGGGSSSSNQCAPYSSESVVSSLCGASFSCQSGSKTYYGCITCANGSMPNKQGNCYTEDLNNPDREICFYESLADAYKDHCVNATKCIKTGYKCNSCASGYTVSGRQSGDTVAHGRGKCVLSSDINSGYCAYNSISEAQQNCKQSDIKACAKVAGGDYTYGCKACSNGNLPNASYGCDGADSTTVPSDVQVSHVCGYQASTQAAANSSASPNCADNSMYECDPITTSSGTTLYTAGCERCVSSFFEVPSGVGDCHSKNTTSICYYESIADAYRDGCKVAERCDSAGVMCTQCSSGSPTTRGKCGSNEQCAYSSKDAALANCPAGALKVCVGGTYGCVVCNNGNSPDGNYGCSGNSGTRPGEEEDTTCTAANYPYSSDPKDNNGCTESINCAANRWKCTACTEGMFLNESNVCQDTNTILINKEDIPYEVDGDTVYGLRDGNGFYKSIVNDVTGTINISNITADEINEAYAIFANGTVENAQNLGTIMMSDNAVDSYGMSSPSGADLFNGGSSNSTASITIQDFEADAYGMEGSKITNYGVINISNGSETSSGYALKTSGSGGTVQNLGKITVNSINKGYGMIGNTLINGSESYKDAKIELRSNTDTAVGMGGTETIVQNGQYFSYAGANVTNYGTIQIDSNGNSNSSGDIIAMSGTGDNYGTISMTSNKGAIGARDEITNHGTITMNRNGSYTSAPGYLVENNTYGMQNGGTNLGTITITNGIAWAYGIVSGNNGSASNTSATIEMSGNKHFAIGVSDGNNYGTITLKNNATGEQYGSDYLRAYGMIGNSTNYGKIIVNTTGNAHAAGMVGNNMTNASSGEITLRGNRLSYGMYGYNITNNGSITMRNNNTTGYIAGIYQSSSGTSTNNGTITLEGNIVSSSTVGSYAIYGMYDNISSQTAEVGELFNGSASNKNAKITIKEYDGDTVGMYSQKMVNYGTIEIDGSDSSGKAYGMYVNGSYSSNERVASITNNGTIIINDADAAYGIYYDYPMGYGEITNTGTITITGSSTAYGIYASGTGITVTNTGTISINGNSCTGSACGSTNNAIVLENGATLQQMGTMSAMSLDLSSFGGNVLASESSRFEVTNALSGDLLLSSDVVKGGFDDTYAVTDMIDAGDVSGLNLLSQSALFDAKLENESDAVLKMKDFNTVVENSSVADFLKQNYASGNNEELFNLLKKQENISALNNAVDALTGADVFNRFNFEDMTMMRELNMDVNNVLFNDSADHLTTSGTIAPFYFDSDSGSDGKYALYNTRIGRHSYGLTMAFTNVNSSDRKNDNYRSDESFQMSVPFGYKTHGFKFITAPRFGYAYGTYDRNGYDGRVYEGTVEKRMFGLMNEMRYPIDMDGWSLAPAAEFNLLGYHIKGHEQKSPFALNIRGQDNYSVEAGLGLYANKDMKIGKQQRLKMYAGMAVYHEFADPYTTELNMQGMSGSFRVRDARRKDNRAVLRGGFDYGFAEDFSLIGTLATFIDGTTHINANVDFKYNF